MYTPSFEREIRCSTPWKKLVNSAGVADETTGPTAATLIDKQRLIIVERVLSDVLSWTDASKKKHFFSMLEGKTVGKSQTIKAITAVMDLIFRKDEVILTAPHKILPLSISHPLSFVRAVRWL